MSRRKISSESFSSLGSDYLETSPEEESECPVARLCWNGSRSPPAQAGAATPAAAAGPPLEAAAAAAPAGSRRAPRRRRVNLDSLGESISRLTAPTVSALRPGRGQVCVRVCRRRSGRPARLHWVRKPRERSGKNKKIPRVRHRHT